MSQCSPGKAESETARNRLTQRLLAPLHSGITSVAEVLRHAVAGMLDDVRFERVLSVIVSDRNGCLEYIQRLACRETLTPDERSSEQVEQVLLAGEQVSSTPRNGVFRSVCVCVCDSLRRRCLFGRPSLFLRPAPRHTTR